MLQVPARCHNIKIMRDLYLQYVPHRCYEENNLVFLNQSKESAFVAATTGIWTRSDWNISGLQLATIINNSSQSGPPGYIVILSKWTWATCTAPIA